jgi:hypothetical protein
VRKTSVNFAVNNDGHYYPRITATWSPPGAPLGKLVDGNYWYSTAPPNRWTCEGSPNATDHVTIDLGTTRTIDTIRLYLLDDGGKVGLPEKIALDYHDGKQWKPIRETNREPAKITGRRANVVRFAPLEAGKVRATFTHGSKGKTGLTEFEIWGETTLPVALPTIPKGNLAYNPGGKPFPKASASNTSRFDKVEQANDGVISFTPTPHNRWTSYESTNKTDWLMIDFGGEKEVSRVELALYDDGGGVQAPRTYTIQYWTGKEWADVSAPKKTPEQPTGGQLNEVRFAPIKTSKVRVVFTHKGKARSGVSEILIWKD